MFTKIYLGDKIRLGSMESRIEVVELSEGCLDYSQRDQQKDVWERYETLGAKDTASLINEIDN